MQLSSFSGAYIYKFRNNLRRQLRDVKSSRLLWLLHPGIRSGVHLEPSLVHTHTQAHTYMCQHADLHKHTQRHKHRNSVSHRQPQTRLCPQQPPHLDSPDTGTDGSLPPLWLAEAEGHKCSKNINSQTVKIIVSPALHQIV